MRVTACRSCGAPIVWIKTRAGKSMPCDAKPVNYRFNPEGRDKLVTPAGDVVGCVEVVPYPANETEIGYRTHWATCNAPDSFRKRRT